MKKYICYMIIVLLLFTSSGCQLHSKDIGEGKQSAGKASGEAAGKEGMEETSNILYQQLEIPSEVVKTPLTEQGEHSYSVNAKVLIPGEAVSGIFKEQKATMDIDYINCMADKLFDGGNYQQIKPLACYSFDELTAMKDKLLKKLSDKESETYYADKTRYTEILCLLRQPRDKVVVPIYQEGDFCKVQTEEDDNYLWRCEEVYILEGKISGTVYQLAAYKEEGQINIRIAQMTEGYSEFFPGRDIENSLGSLDPIVSDSEEEMPQKEENPVVGEPRFNSMADSKSNRQSYEKALEEGSLKYSEEEAAELACSFMKQLLSEDVTTTYKEFRTGAHADCYALRDLDETPFNFTQGNPPMDGYKFALQRKIKELPCTNVETVRNLTDSGEAVETRQEYFEAEVSNRGVVNIRIMEPIYEITETLKDTPELMKFPDIMEIMENALKEETQFFVEEGNYTENFYLINQIALSYVTVQYDKEYALIPVWCFQEVTNGASVGQPYLIISAVDGSILYRPEHGSEEE